MPKGPQGQKRPADTIGAAIKVAMIATGEIEEPKTPPKGHKGGKAGGKARASKLTEGERKSIAKKGATARWKK